MNRNVVDNSIFLIATISCDSWKILNRKHILDQLQRSTISATQQIFRKKLGEMMKEKE